MNAEQLLFAIGDLNEQTVAAAACPPKRRVTPLWVTVTAVAAAVVVGVLGYVGFLKSQQQKPPMGGSVPGAVTTPVVTTTTLWGTGGDANACTVHSFHYHAIDSYLLRLVDEDTLDEYRATHKGEEFNIISFVRFCGITREQFVTAMKWEDMLDMTAMGLDPYAPYTYGRFLDAIYGDNAELTAWVFHRETAQRPQTDDAFLMEGMCPVHNLEYHRFNGELIEYVGQDVWQAYCDAYGDKGEEANILTFVDFCDITREEYIAVMGWENALGHIAVEHGLGYEYTCGEFLEALYGDDEAFREYMFSWKVFPMLNTTTEPPPITFYTGPSTTSTSYTGRPTTTSRMGTTTLCTTTAQ